MAGCSGFEIVSTILTILLSTVLWGSGGGSVGRATASNTRDLRFESHHLPTNCKFKQRDENIEKVAGNGPSLKSTFHRIVTRF